jgi:hypothetical protein
MKVIKITKENGKYQRIPQIQHGSISTAYKHTNRCNEGNLKQEDFNHSERKVPNLAEQASDLYFFYDWHRNISALNVICVCFYFGYFVCERYNTKKHRTYRNCRYIFCHTTI